MSDATKAAIIIACSFFAMWAVTSVSDDLSKIQSSEAHRFFITCAEYTLRGSEDRIKCAELALKLHAPSNTTEGEQK